MHECDWILDSRTSVRSLEELSVLLALTKEESAWHMGECSPPLCISRYYLGLIDPGDPDDPIRRQVVPTASELAFDQAELADPLAEQVHSVTSRLIHRYTNRVAFLVTDTCATYCRHCFRRRFTGLGGGCASLDEVQEAARYVGAHPEVKEILFTGGDPFTLSDTKLDWMIGVFRMARPDLIVRLCSRIPVTFPQRIDGGLIGMLKGHSTAPFYLFTHFNHPREITEQSRLAVARFVDAGIPVMNQTVLLHKVNDDADTLETLMNALVAIRVKPYYLFQGDLVNGTHHFRVPLERGIALEAELRKRLSGLAMPVYAVDLPQGGGKIPLGKSYLACREADGAWVFNTPDGQQRIYRDPLAP
ncbi:MAG: KamA family radical SAM protein [Sphaerochaetaceae bacterium]